MLGGLLYWGIGGFWDCGIGGLEDWGKWMNGEVFFKDTSGTLYMYDLREFSLFKIVYH